MEQEIIGYSAKIKEDMRQKDLIKKSNAKTKTITIRLTEAELSRLQRACFRDEIKLSVFAQEAVMVGLEHLIKEQNRKGYQCSQPL